MTAMRATGTLSSASELAQPYTRTSAAPPTALATGLSRDEIAIWNDALEKMLAWRSDPEQFEPEDAPEIEILDTAIDFAVDMQEKNMRAPTSIVPSGSGRIAFEWRSCDETSIVEFVGRGRANFTGIIDGKVIVKHAYVRNPKSRKLELEG